MADKVDPNSLYLGQRVEALCHQLSESYEEGGLMGDLLGYSRYNVPKSLDPLRSWFARTAEINKACLHLGHQRKAYLSLAEKVDIYPDLKRLCGTKINMAQIHFMNLVNSAKREFVKDGRFARRVYGALVDIPSEDPSKLQFHLFVDRTLEHGEEFPLLIEHESDSGANAA